MNDAEHREQVRLFAWAEWARIEWPELGLLFAVPNGGARDVVTGKRLKDEGVKRGVPDVWLPVARGGFHGLVIELKADERGRATKEQEGWIKALTREGYWAVVARGMEQARGIIEWYLGQGSGGEAEEEAG